jgi:hypothetical protein
VSDDRRSPPGWLLALMVLMIITSADWGATQDNLPGGPVRAPVAPVHQQ